MRVTPLKKFVLVLALLSMSGMSVAYARNTRQYKAALDMYRHGMYERAMSMFEAQQEDDDLCADYALLCAVKLRSGNCGRRVEAMDEDHPRTMINSRVHLEYALLLFDEGKYTEATAEFAKVNTRGMKRAEIAEYWYKRGFCEYEKNNFEDAEQYLGKAAQKESMYSGPARFGLGCLYYRRGDFQKAASWFELCEDDERFRLLSQFYLVDCRFMMKDYEYVAKKGEAIFPELTAERKQHMSRLLSESYLVNGNAQKAQQYLDQENMDFSKMTRSDFFHAASVHYALGEYDKAVKFFNLMTDKTDSIGQIASYQLGYSYIKTKNKVQAMSAFKDASNLRFDDAITEDAFFNYAKLAFDLDGNDSVFSDYIAKYSTSRKGEMIYNYLAMSALKKRDYAAAVDAYSNIDELDNSQKLNYVKANYLRADQLIRNGNNKDAVVYLKAASTYFLPKSNQFNQLCRYTLAQTQYASESYRDALKTFTELYNLSALHSRQEGKLIPYDIAYCYFKLSEYQSAAKWFDTYLKSGDKFAREDALTRRADCDFAQKNYKSAAQNYRALISEYPSTDNIYPYYHLGVSYGLIGENRREVEALSMVMDAPAGSKYYNEALYMLGRVYQETGSNDLAIGAFEQLESTTNAIDFKAKALMGKGMVLRNAGRYDESLESYKKVVSAMPGTEYSSDALLSIQSIYNAMKQPEKYIEYLEANDLSTGQNESDRRALYFNTAEQVFLAGNYEGAIKSFNRYLSEYPEGKNVPETYYYLAESYKQLGAKEKAAQFYRLSLDGGINGSFAELALVNYAAVSYSLEHYEDAYSAYHSLLAFDDMLSSKVDATAGLMRSAYRGKMYDEAIEAGAAVLKIAPDADLRREAKYVQAKSYFTTSRREEAFELFTELSKEADTAEGAESYYLIIQSRFDWGKFEEVENGVYDFAERCGDQTYWLARAFIVLADSFAERGNIEQAVVTFESLRDGYTASEEGDDILEMVELKLMSL